MATTDDVLARVRAEDREDREILRGLSTLAWHWAKEYGSKRPAPTSSSSRDEVAGWQAYRRGYTFPPVWLLEEILKRQMRQ